jgi:hypothetical protein
MIFVNRHDTESLCQENSYDYCDRYRHKDLSDTTELHERRESHIYRAEDRQRQPMTHTIHPPLSSLAVNRKSDRVFGDTHRRSRNLSNMMVKYRLYCNHLPNLESHMLCQTGMLARCPLRLAPRILSSRSRISRAALFVNVTARIWRGQTLRTSTRYATRWVSTRVLPEPGPARTSTGPSGASTARACWGLSPCSKSIESPEEGVKRLYHSEK